VTYSAKDLERATSLLETYSFVRDMDAKLAPPLPELIAEKFADVRREALEEAAVSVERFDEQAVNEQFIASRKHMARRIRALKDGAK
jgi:hypothetical protein